MANTINPNSFFNQEQVGGNDSAMQLAQSAFNLAENIKSQVNDLVKNLEAFKIEFNENNQFITNISNNFEEIKQENIQRDEIIKQSFSELKNNFTQVTQSIEMVSDDVDAVSKVFFDFQGAQVKDKEAALDQAWEQEDAAQKASKKSPKGGGGGGGSGPSASGSLDANDGFVKDGTDKKRGFFGGLGRALISPITATMHATAALGGTITHGIQGGLDWLTGNRTDFDAEGGERRDIPGTKMFRGLKNMFKRDGDEKTTIKSKVNTRYDPKTKKGYINGKEVSREEFIKFKKLSEDDQLNYAERLTEDSISPTESKDDNGLKPEGEKKKKQGGLFGRLFGKKEDEDDPIQESVKKKKGGLFSGLFGKKEDGDDPIQKKVRPKIDYRKLLDDAEVSLEEAKKSGNTNKIKGLNSKITFYKNKLEEQGLLSKPRSIINSKGETIWTNQTENNNLDIKPTTKDQSVESLVEPPPDDSTEIMDAISQSGMNQTVDETDQDDDTGSPSSDTEFTPATGTYCQIECINTAKSNSSFNLMYI